MAWELLPTDYTDAIWNGLKKYNLISNDDSTISLQDVTVYTNKENSFFGALQANRMNEALNTIMSMVENGTDLYEAFQIYFETQKALFKDEVNSDYTAFEQYVSDLEKQGDSIIENIKSDYRSEMDEYEASQKQLFDVWFQGVRDKLSGDVATNLQNEIDELDKKVDGFTDRNTVFSEDGKTITETWDVYSRVTTFNADESIKEEMYEDGLLTSTKITKFSADGRTITEEVS